MNENFILVGRKCFSLDLTNLEDEFVDFFSSSPFSSDAVRYLKLNQEIKRFFILAFSIFDKFFKKFCSYLLHFKKSLNMPNNCKNILQSCVEIIIPP